MGDVIRGKRTITLKQKVKSVRILATGTQFQGNSPANITLKAIAQNFDAVGYSWIKLSTNKQISTAQQITIKNAEIDVVDTYRVEVKDSKGDLYQDTISLTKVTDGKPGDVGKRGQIPVQREWKQGDTYYNNDSVMDYIYHRATDSWWRLRDGYNEVKAGVNPSNEFVQLNSLEHLALSYIIAENANLAGFIFKDNKLISQLPNVDNPNLIIDGVNGKITAKDADIKGHIEATSGKFTGEINATSGNIKNVNATNLTVENLNATNGTIKNIKGENIDINGGTFKGEVIFKNGVSAEDTIDQKVKEGVDSVQVGGRNLLLNSIYNLDLRDNNGSVNPTERDYDKEEKCYYIKKRTSDGGNIISIYSLVLLKGSRVTTDVVNEDNFKDYVCSVDVKTEADMYVYLGNPGNKNYAKNKVLVKAGIWTRISNQLEGSTRINAFGVGASDLVRDKKIFYKNYKLEKGSIATDWTPAPEDLESQIQDQEIYIEYSKDGATNWHYPAKTDDVFYRQKKGNGAWSANIRIAGIDGKNGSNGKDGKYQVQQYAKNTSLTVAPTSGWANAIPTSSASEYVWMRTGDVTPPATTPTAWSAAVRITGNRGSDGKDGKDGVDGKAGKFSIYNFAKSTSLTTAPTTGWVATPPAISATEYLWQRIGDVIPPATAPTSWSNAVRISGPAGANGKDGTNGKDGVQGSKGDNGKDGVNGTNGKDGKYTIVQFAKNSSFTTAPTTGWSTNQPTITDKEYLWMRTGEVTPPATAPTTWKTATRISGIHGQDGEDIKGVNLLSIKHLDEYKIIDDNGKDISNGTDFVGYMDYQEITPTKSYYVGYFAIGAAYGGEISTIHAFYYNASKAFISKQVIKNEEGKGMYQPKRLTIPTSSKYVRFNFWNNGSEYGLRIKLEQSDVATAYTASYEDLGGALAPLQQTEILGGTITTGVLGVSNNNRDIVAGMTGEGFSSNTDTIIWAGANHDKKHLAPFQVKADGSIIANNGKFSGEINATSGTFENITGKNITVDGGKFIGEIDARTGKIGPLLIESTKLQSTNAYYRIELKYDYIDNNFLQIGNPTHFSAEDIAYNKNSNALGEPVGIFVKDKHSNGDISAIVVKATHFAPDYYKSHAINILGGDIAGMSLYTKIIGPNDNKYDITDESFIIVNSNKPLTVHLPGANHRWNGRVVEIKRVYNDGYVDLWGSGARIWVSSSIVESQKLSVNGRADSITLVFYKDTWWVKNWQKSW